MPIWLQLSLASSFGYSIHAIHVMQFFLVRAPNIGPPVLIRAPHVCMYSSLLAASVLISRVLNRCGFLFIIPTPPYPSSRGWQEALENSSIEAHRGVFGFSQVSIPTQRSESVAAASSSSSLEVSGVRLLQFCWTIRIAPNGFGGALPNAIPCRYLSVLSLPSVNISSCHGFCAKAAAEGRRDGFHCNAAANTSQPACPGIV